VPWTEDGIQRRERADVIGNAVEVVSSLAGIAATAALIPPIGEVTW
jgi:hypothetical protein